MKKLPVVQRFRRVRLPPWAASLLCLLTLCATLVAGLRPFHAPFNDVAWLKGSNGVQLGRYGTVLSQSAFQNPAEGADGSLELWVRPAKIWARGCILSFYDSHAKRLFRIEQDYTDLVLRLGEWDTDDERTSLRVQDVFRKKEVFITVSFDGKETHVYIDGRLERSSIVFRLSSSDLSGRLILGNAPLRNYSWAGQLKGLAIYAEELNAAQALQQHRSWRERGEPVPGSSGQLSALYQFREHEGRTTRSSVSTGVTLVFPKRFLVVDQLRFESLASELKTEDSYFKNALLNVVGFIPLGFTVGLYTAGALRMRRAGLATVLLGTTVSVAIEYFQGFLPTRYSGCTDFFTNTFGTWIGFQFCKWLVFTTKFRLSDRAVK